MKRLNFTSVFCLLALLTVGTSVFGQGPDRRVRGTQISTIENAVPGNYILERQGIHVLGPIASSNAAAGGVCDTILFEDFQSETIPATWLNIDVDGNADANGLPQDWFIYPDMETTVGIDTNWVAAASSWFSPFAQANNWLILDSVAICDPSVVLRWESAPFQGPGFADGYKVLASPTADTALSSFTDTLAVLAEDISGNGSGIPGPGWVHSTYNGTRGVLETWIVPLTGYNGSSIRIAFVHDSDDDVLLLLDNIFLGSSTVFDGDMAQVSGASGEYPIVPASQVQAMTFTGVIQNSGGTNVSNAGFNVEVYDGAQTQVFAGSTTVASLSAFTDTLLSVSGYTPPAAADQYGVVYYANSGSQDPDNSNDTLTGSFIVDDSIYARDNGVITGNLSIGETSAGFIGQEFMIVNDDTLTHASFWLQSPDLGDTVRAVVIPMGPAGMPPSGAPIAISEDLAITDTTGQLYDLAFPGGVPLAGGTSYFLGLEETVAGVLTLGTSNEVFTPGKGWVFFNGMWDNSEFYNRNVAYVLRAVFGTPVMVGIEDQLRADISVYPVPAQDNINIAVTPGLHEDLAIRVSDIQGRTLITQILPSGTDIAKVDVSDLSSGLYFVEVRSGKDRYVQRVTIE